MLVAVASLAMAVAAPAAGAQEDPYGPTSTTSPPTGVDPTCSTVVSGEIGSEQTATVMNVPFGATVRILIGGVEAGSATAPSAFQAATTTLNVAFTVPDLAPGSYSLVAVGSDFTLTCTSDGQFDVLAANTGTGGGDDDGGGSLAFTGANILLLVLLALLLIVLGRIVVKRSARSRQTA